MARLPYVDIVTRQLVLIECGKPAVRADRYECEHGHSREATVCREHIPAPEIRIGCTFCLVEDCHDCPMTTTMLWDRSTAPMN